VLFPGCSPEASNTTKLIGPLGGGASELIVTQSSGALGLLIHRGGGGSSVRRHWSRWPRAPRYAELEIRWGGKCAVKWTRPCCGVASCAVTASKYSAELADYYARSTGTRRSFKSVRLVFGALLNRLRGDLLGDKSRRCQLTGVSTEAVAEGGQKVEARKWRTATTNVPCLPMDALHLTLSTITGDPAISSVVNLLPRTPAGPAHASSAVG